MAARGCKYSADCFCYVCGEFFAKSAKKHNLDGCVRAREAYHAYFGMPVGDQDKPWAPHVICDYCRRTLEGWFRGEKRAMRFAVPRVWREPTNHLTDCYFCMVDPRRARMPLQLTTPTFHYAWHQFLIIPMSCLYQSLNQSGKLVQQKRPAQMNPVRRLLHLLSTVDDAEDQLRDAHTIQSRRTSMTSSEICR